MKKIAQVALIGIAGLALLAFSAPSGSSSFEGVITYSMTFGSGVSPQAAAMMQGSTRKVYIKGNKVRTEVSTGMYKSVVIGDSKTKDEVTLVEMMGNKYEIKSNPEDKKEAAADKPEFKYLDSTKKIAGYTCHSAVVTITNHKTGEKYNSTIYYTDQLPYTQDMGQFQGLKGFPLQFGIKQRGMDMTITAQSVEKKSLPDSLFVVPTSGYKIEGSQQDMMKDIQKSMGGGQ